MCHEWFPLHVTWSLYSNVEQGLYRGCIFAGAGTIGKDEGNLEVAGIPYPNASGCMIAEILGIGWKPWCRLTLVGVGIFDFLDWLAFTVADFDIEADLIGGEWFACHFPSRSKSKSPPKRSEATNAIAQSFMGVASLKRIQIPRLGSEGLGNKLLTEAETR